MCAGVRFVSRLVAFALPVLLAAAAPVDAQSANVTSATTGFAELQQALEPGDTLILTLEDGQKTKGKLVEVGAGLLRIRQGDAEGQFESIEIRKVQRKRMGIKLGAPIGAAVGAALYMGVAAALEEDAQAGGLLLTVGEVALIGLGIDAAINLPRTVYEREHAVVVAPIVKPHAMGVSVQMAF